MRSRFSELKHLFSKFGVLTKKEIRIIYGNESPGRSQLDRYMAELRRLKLIKRRADPESDQDAFEAAPCLLDTTGTGPKDGFRDLAENEINHRLKCTEALVWLCRRSFVSGVAIEHELTPSDRARFCPDRIPDGIAQISRPGLKPFEVAVEVELTQRSVARMKRVIDLYEKTIMSGRTHCRGLLLITTTDACWTRYSHLIAEKPAAFRNKVVLSRFLDTQDIADDLLGVKFPSALMNPRNPCASRRQDAHGTVKYLNDFFLYTRLGPQRGVAGQRSELRKE